MKAHRGCGRDDRGAFAGAGWYTALPQIKYEGKVKYTNYHEALINKQNLLSNNFSFMVEAAADSFTFHFSFRRACTDSFYFFNMWLFRVSVTEAYLMFCMVENMQAYQ